MAFFDLPIDQLQDCGRPSSGQTTVETFWSATLDVELSRPLEPRIVRLETPLRTLDVYDVSWVGYSGQRVQAWPRLPADAAEPLPTVLDLSPVARLPGLPRLGTRGQGDPYYPWNGHEGGADHHTWHRRSVARAALRLEVTTSGRPPRT